VTDGTMTENGLDMLKSGEKLVSLYSLSDERYHEICETLWLNPADLTDAEHPAGVLINTSGTYIRQGRRHNFTPYQGLVNSELSLTVAGEPHVIPIAAETPEIPTEIALLYAANNVNLIVPESVVAAWTPDDLTLPLSVTVMTVESDAFEDAANAFLASAMEENEYTVINYEQYAANNRNIWLLIMIFIYGFIAMLSLISVTNVVTTVSTGIALRKRELAMLRSVGMTGSELAKSLRYESLIYAAKALLFGLPLGVGASLVMYQALDVSMSFEYELPWQSVLISVAAILTLSFATMAFAAKKQRGASVAGVLQDEIV
jgi:putative ABC transport system permease protein